MATDTDRLKVLCAGIFSLVLMVGVARFAYTPLLVLMQQQAGLGIAASGWLATINYVGYLCGAVIASRISDLSLKDTLYRWGLILAIVTTVAMGLTEQLWLWALMRFLAGLSSAAAMLLGSGLILNWLLRHGHRGELGIHFIGMGLGIAVCALFVELLVDTVAWDWQWLLLGALGVVFLIPAWFWLPKPTTAVSNADQRALRDNPPSTAFLKTFMAAYFCAGVGYVVGITFIVALVDQMPGLEGQGAWVYMILGVCAAPACIIWDLIARRLGFVNTLIIAFALQVVGIILPLLAPSLWSAFVGAGLFGFTFIGIVSLVLTMAGLYYPSKPATMMGKMTIAYGTAQILAPAVTGVLAEGRGGYEMGFYLSALVMLVGIGLMLILKALEKRQGAVV